MKFILTFLLITLSLHAQLKEFDITEREAPQYPALFVNYPDDAAIIIYTSVKEISFESNIDAIVTIKNESDKITLIVKTERQIIKVKKSGYIEGRISIPKLAPRDVRYFALETKNPNSNKIPVHIISNPADAIIFVDGNLIGVTTNVMLTPGVHKLSIIKDNYHTKELDIEVNEKNSLFFINLKPVNKVKYPDPVAFSSIAAIGNVSLVYSSKQLSAIDYFNFDLLYTRGYNFGEPQRIRFLSGTFGSYVPISSPYQFIKGENIETGINYLENRTLFSESARILLALRLIKIGVTYSLLNDGVEVVTCNLHYSPGLFKKHIKNNILVRQPDILRGNIELDYTVTQSHYFELSVDLVVPLPKRSRSFPLQLEIGYRYFIPNNIKINAKGKYITNSNGNEIENSVDQFFNASYKPDNMNIFYLRIGIPVYGYARL